MKEYAMREAVWAAKRAAIVKVLPMVDGNIKDAAEILEIGESTLHRLILDFGITEEERYSDVCRH